MSDDDVYRRFLIWWFSAPKPDPEEVLRQIRRGPDRRLRRFFRHWSGAKQPPMYTMFRSPPKPKPCGNFLKELSKPEIRKIDELLLGPRRRKKRGDEPPPAPVPLHRRRRRR